MTQQHLLPKFGSGKEADGKAAGSVLTDEDESTKVATTVTAEECDGEDLQRAR